MGETEQERRNVYVPESTWRKGKILAAAFGLPISAIVKQALDELAENHLRQVEEFLKGGETP